VGSQPFQQARDLATAEAGQVGPQTLVLETGDVEFATGNHSEQEIILLVEEIKAAIGALLLTDRLAELAQLPDAVARIVKGGDEFQIAGWRR
jgi:hypothetical protein